MQNRSVLLTFLILDLILWYKMSQTNNNLTYWTDDWCKIWTIISFILGCSVSGLGSLPTPQPAFSTQESGHSSSPMISSLVSLERCWFCLRFSGYWGCGRVSANTREPTLLSCMRWKRPKSGGKLWGNVLGLYKRWNSWPEALLCKNLFVLVIFL